MKQFSLALGAGCALAGCSGASAPEKVVETFMMNMQEGRCQGIADSITAASRQRFGAKLEAACSRGLLKDRSGKQLASVKLLDKQENGDRATVRVQPQFTDGSSGEPRSIVLIEQDGSWRIDPLATAMSGRGGIGGSFGRPQPPASDDPVDSNLSGVNSSDTGR